MTKQLFVVVHGVGVREAGTTTELLSASLKTPELPAHSSDDFHLCEPPEYDRGGKARIFPAHLRRFRATPNSKGRISERVIADFYWGDIAAVTGGAVGAVLAFFRIAMGLGHAIRENARDVFPGDGGWNRAARRIAGLSVLAIHGPVVAINLALLVGMLVTWASGDVAQRLVGWLSWQLRDPKLLFDLALTVVAVSATGAMMQIRTHTYLSRFLGRWLIATAAILLMIGGIHYFSASGNTGSALVNAACAIFPTGTKPQAFAVAALGDMAQVMGALSGLIEPAATTLNTMAAAITTSAHVLQSEAGATQTSCKGAFTDIYLIGLWLYLVMMVFMTLSLLGMAFVAFRSWRLFHKDRHRRHAIRNDSATLAQGERVRGITVTDLVTPALGLMLLLWFLLISTVFGAIGFLEIAFLDGIVPQEVVITALRGVIPAVLGVLLLLVFAGWVFLVKFKTFKPKSSDTLRGSARRDNFDLKSYLDDADGFAERSRLLVAKPMLVVPILFVLSLFMLFLHALGAFEFAWLDRLLSQGTGAALVILAFIGVALVAYLREAFAAGLGVLTDVLAYLNDYSWAHNRLEAQIYAAAMTDRPAHRFFADPNEKRIWARIRDYFLTLFGWKLLPPREDKPQGYWLRNRIQDRFRVLMEALINAEEPDELVIISHSQGTVIVLDVLKGNGLREDGLNWRKRVNSITLVTMGSPARHLYTHYFPSSFPDYSTHPVLRKGAGVLDEWVNVFRVDDFIGTHICSDIRSEHATNWPIEVPVPANGHTNYWIDRNVTRELHAILQQVGNTANSS